MPHNSSQWVTHKIDGGWATDYGNTFYSTPQDGVLRIPWCRTCEDIRFYQDGSFGKYPGLTTINTVPIKAPPSSTGYIESSTVSSLFSYSRLGSSLSATVKRVAVVGSWLYDITSGSAPVRIGDLQSSGSNVHRMATFNDLLIIGGPGAAKSWDQTTFQNLAGTPPVFEFSTAHNGRHWAAGVAALPSRLYYSVAGNPEDWVGAGSGSIDIDPGDGDAIVGLLSWKRELWVFKGPHKLSIHRITGSSASDFARVPFITGVSAASHTSIFPVGDDFAFWSPRGSCHSLSATSNYGDYAQSYINYPILSWCRDPSKLTGGNSARGWQTVTDGSQNISYSLFNNHAAFGYGSQVIPRAIMMDWRFRSDTNPYPRFIPLTLSRFSSIAMTQGKFDDSQYLPTFGTNDGFITQEFPLDLGFYTNSGAAFPYNIETPSLSYGPTVHKKTIISVSVDVVSNFNSSAQYGTLAFSYGGRNAPAQTINFSATGGGCLGSFTLGVDHLASAGEIPDYYENINGESRAFTYRFRETSALSASQGQDVRVKHFGVLITPSGESLETT